MTLFTNMHKKLYYWHFIVAFIILKYIIITVIDYHQYRYITSPRVPADLAQNLTQEEWKKSRVKMFLYLSTTFSQNFFVSAANLALIGLGLLPWLWTRWVRFCRKRLEGLIDPGTASLISLLFYLMYVLVRWAYDQLPTLIVYGGHKALPLLPVLLQPVLGAYLLQASILMRKRFIFAVITIIFLLMSTYGAFFKAPLQWRSQRGKFPLGELSDQIVALCSRIGFPTKNIIVSPKFNNAQTFSVGKLAYIRFGGKYLKKFQNNDQIVAVAAHELGHWRHWHIMYDWALIYVFSLVKFAGFFCMITRPQFYQAFEISIDLANGVLPYGIGFIILDILSSELKIVLKPIWNAYSWMQEYQADLYANELGYGQHLYDGFVVTGKAEVQSIATLPFGLLYMDHPTYARRLAALKAQLKP